MVDVEGSVHFTSSGELNKIPVQFGYVSRNFNVSDNNLTSLQGSPREVGGYFNISANNLTSLTGAPKEVGGGFYISNNKFTSEPDHSFIKIGGKFSLVI